MGVVHRGAEVLRSDVDVHEDGLGPAGRRGEAVGGAHRGELVWAGHELGDGPGLARLPEAGSRLEQWRVVRAEVREDVLHAVAFERAQEALGRRGSFPPFGLGAAVTVRPVGHAPQVSTGEPKAVWNRSAPR